MVVHKQDFGRGGYIVGLVATLTGCYGGDDALHLTHSKEPLVVRSDAELPEVTDFPLAVCFRTDADGTQAERDAVREHVEAAWEGLPRSAIDFSGWDMCADNSSTALIRIYLDSSVSGGLYSWGSRHARLLRGSSNYIKYVNVHEFGHALGIRHEQSHPEKPASCTDVESLPGDALVLTQYDPYAIMNYCASTPTLISEREKLFAEMAFPSDTADHPLRASVGYETPQHLLVRSNAELQTAWTARGALAVAYMQVRWFVGSTTFDAVTLSVAELEGPTTVDYDFVDFRGEAHTGLARTVMVSDARHAALTVSVL